MGWNEEKAIDFWMTMIFSAILIACGLAQCVAPCSWLMWEPIKEIPGRCVQGVGR